jgi:large subunit ribosomal protein L24|tara:strand:+ start:463 stop:771 length:309 start_codon:yes stop_codon:yes gene_type:complete
MKIRKNDTVLVIKGKDRGKQGVVQKAFLNEKKVLVEGLNMIKKHSKAQANRAAGIIEKEMPLPVANVMLICPHCLAPTKVGSKELGDGTKGRMCKKCPEVIE